MDKFKAPQWCPPTHSGVKDAILAAAEKVGAQIYMSASFIFRIDDFEKVEAFFKKNGKQPIVDEIIKFVNK